MLLVYGFLCRYLNIYFFWDSRSFGALTVAVAIISFLIDMRVIRVAQRKSIFWVRFGVGIMILFFALNIVVVIIFKSSPAYKNAVELVTISETVKSETGDVRGISMIPLGTEVISFIKGEQTGWTSFVVTVRGAKQHRDVRINLEKNPQTMWSFTGIEVVRY